ncbi:MAG: N-6 DNA methylase [Candidatus Gracilibacteria bacterium]|nr:N-6 DNA methylase [Candidatus Gracilibacteria bacterium]
MKNLFEKLKISENKNLFEFSDKTKGKNNIPARLHKGLYEINPDYFFVQENKIIALFFDFTEENREDKIFKDIWNLGGSPIIFILKNGLLDIYNGFNFDTKNTKFKQIKEQIKLNSKELEEFSLLNMLSGNLWDSKKFEKKNTVDEELLKNLKNTRKTLIEELNLNKEITTNIIGRLLFSRYLVDRKVKVEKEFQGYFENKTEFAKLIQNKELLYKYFEYLKITFNGDLFPVLTLEKDNIDEKEEINEKHLEIIFHLFNGDDIGPGKEIQQSLFNLYDFKIIPIELISEIYEQFMGDKQDKNSAFYTPSFLVDYILEKTVKKHLLTNNECRVFDPSCGSGIFLVESLSQIIEKI